MPTASTRKPPVPGARSKSDALAGPLPAFVSVKDAARLSSLCTNTIFGALRGGRLKRYQPTPGRTLLKTSEVLAWIERSSVEPAEAGGAL
jgi:hypothetical protein